MKQTLYDVLGVKPDASFEDIQVAHDKRFAQLRAETGFDSNRLVLLHEAKEVLSDPVKRAAYDVSLTSPPPPHHHIETIEDDDEQRSFGKWVVAAIVLVVIVAWWATRDAGVPDDVGEAMTADLDNEAAMMETEALDAEDEDEEIADEAAVEEDLEVAQAVSSSVPVTETPVAAAQTVAVAESSAADSVQEAVAVSPVVGNWECFDPVSGRSSQFGFGADGQLAMQQTGGGTQTFKYELKGTQVNLADADPPYTMAIEELTEKKLVLNTAGEGRRVVCSR